MEKITQADLNLIIRKHIMFMTAKPGGARAVVRDKDLSGLSFLGQNLAQSDFTGSNLSGADLNNANFESATLFGCDMSNTKLRNTRLCRADMRGAILEGTDLSSADTTGADMREGKTFVKRKGMNAFAAPHEKPEDMHAAPPAIDLSVKTDENTHVHDIEMTPDELLFLHVRWVESAGRHGKRFDIAAMDLRGRVSFSAQKLTAMKAAYTRMGGMNFRGADLQSAVFDECEMKECDMGHADARGAFFVNTDMSYARFAQANLTPLYLKSRDGQKQEIPCRFENTKLAYADFSGADLRRAVFFGADLSHADFSDADLRGADFSGALMEGALLDNARKDGAILPEKPYKTG